MKLSVNLPAHEVRKIIAEFLTLRLKMKILEMDITSDSYGGGVKYECDTFELMPKPPEHPAPRRPEPKLTKPEFVGYSTPPNPPGSGERVDLQTFDEFSALPDIDNNPDSDTPF